MYLSITNLFISFPQFFLDSFFSSTLPKGKDNWLETDKQINIQIFQCLNINLNLKMFKGRNQRTAKNKLFSFQALFINSNDQKT
ncbi:hypothetical protein BpHYR1_017332 [Brachionus plicatilis]|uniref:Uncharacterized protein n=1 Tax=Brachionus plicatilis TaxID=10195 RepID=A0A3M7Q1H6_BRAPC|nr:hypothetical protein BpHYR1_017332 [Brachionus plicatilis]